MSQLKYASLIEQSYTTSEQKIGCRNIDLVTVDTYTEEESSVITDNIGYKFSGYTKLPEANDGNVLLSNGLYFLTLTSFYTRSTITVDSTTTFSFKLKSSLTEDITYYLILYDYDYNILHYSNSSQVIASGTTDYMDLTFDDIDLELEYGTIYHLGVFIEPLSSNLYVAGYASTANATSYYYSSSYEYPPNFDSMDYTSYYGIPLLLLNRGAI